MPAWIIAFLNAAGEAIVRGLLNRLPKPHLVGGRLAAGVQAAIEGRLTAKGWVLPELGSEIFGEFLRRVVQTISDSSSINSRRSRNAKRIDPGPAPGVTELTGTTRYTVVLEYRNPNGEIRDVVVVMDSRSPLTWSEISDRINVALGDQLSPTSPPPPQSGGSWLIADVRVVSAYRV